MCLVRCAYWKMCMCVLLWKEIHVHFCLLHLSDTLVPENIHTSPTEGNFSKFPHPSGNSNWASYISLNFLVLQNPPTLPGHSNPFCGGSMDIFWNWTIHGYSERAMFLWEGSPHYLFFHLTRNLGSKIWRFLQKERTHPSDPLKLGIKILKNHEQSVLDYTWTSLY